MQSILLSLAQRYLEKYTEDGFVSDDLRYEGREYYVFGLSSERIHYSYGRKPHGRLIAKLHPELTTALGIDRTETVIAPIRISPRYLRYAGYNPLFDKLLKWQLKEYSVAYTVPALRFTNRPFERNIKHHTLEDLRQRCVALDGIRTAIHLDGSYWFDD